MLKRVDDGVVAGVGQSALAPETQLSPEALARLSLLVRRRVTEDLARLMLSRGGLADVVALLGELGPVPDADPQRNFQRAILVLGSEHRFRAVAAHCAAMTDISQGQSEAILPVVLSAELARIAERSRRGLTDVFGRMPSLFHWSLGSMHADIADIIRRRCGAGPYDRRALRRQVRVIITEAAAGGPSTALGWYAAQAASPVRFAASRVHRALTRPLG